MQAVADKTCGMEEFPSPPTCGPCKDSLFRECADVTPVPPDIPGLEPVTPVQANMVVGKKYCHPRNYYNAAKNGVYNRYSYCDWDSSAKMQVKVADRESHRAQRLDKRSWEILSGLEQRMRNRQCSNTKKLVNRAYETSFWKEQLIVEVAAMNVAIDNLREVKRVMEKTLHDLQIPMDITEECLLQREKRTGIDQCHDEVEKCLSKEILTLRRVMSMMRKFIDKANAQIRLDKCTMIAIDVDIRDKNHSQGMDDGLHQLRNSSCSIAFHYGIENVDNTLVDKKTWIKFTRENLLRSSREREKSNELFSEMDGYLRAAAVEVYTAYNMVNHALSSRVQETTDVKNKLQERLLRVNNDIRDLERRLSLLRKAIVDKDLPLKVAQTRLDERTRRMNLELTHDEPMQGLLCEVQELYNTIRQLKETLHENELSMSRMVKVRTNLLHDIAIKENTLQIDQRCVIGRRRFMPMDPAVGPIVNLEPCPHPCT